MVENTSLDDLLNLAEDSWSLYQHVLGVTPEDKTYKRLHDEEESHYQHVPRNESVNKINQRIFELALESIHNKDALSQLTDEMMDYYQSISLQLECKPNLIRFVDQDVTYNISIRNDNYVIVEAWRQDDCVATIPMVNTAQFVVFIRHMDIIANHVSMMDNPEATLLGAHLEKIKKIADTFRPEWREWMTTYADKKLSPLSLYYDKRDAQEYREKLRRLMETKSTEIVDISDMIDMINRVLVDKGEGVGPFFELAAQAVIGDVSLNDKVLDLDRRMKQLRERVPDLMDVFQDPTSIIHLIKQAFYEKNDETCLSLLNEATGEDKEQLKMLIQSFSDTLLRDHAELIIKINLSGAIVFDTSFVKTVMPVLIDAFILSPFTENNRELKDVIFQTMNDFEPDEARDMRVETSTIEEKAIQWAEKSFASKQRQFEDVFQIENAQERMEAVLDLMMPDLELAIENEFGVDQ